MLNDKMNKMKTVGSRAKHFVQVKTTDSHVRHEQLPVHSFRFGVQII